MPTKKSSKKVTPKKTSKKAASKRRAGGRAAVAKGRKFEDEVADLYRLQGAEVIQNIEISNKKVDILATFSYPVRHRVIVECKDEARAVDANQRVMQFYGLLTDARIADKADSAEIITRVPWGDAAKGFAHRRGVRLFTYAEKISKLIDFTPYLKGLVEKFEKQDPARPTEPALGKYYVDLSAQRLTGGEAEKLPVINDYIHEWVRQSGPQYHLAIFGEYGAGKSSLCQKLAHDLAAAFLKDPNSGRVPILLNLREFIGKIDIEAYITSFLDRECGVPNPKINLFRAMNDAGVFLLIFDGLDEMAVKVDAETLEINLMEIEKLAASPDARVILTSRPEFFVSAKEEREAISPALHPLPSRNVDYNPLRILPWDEGQVEQFLRQRVPLVEEATKPWTYYRDQIKNIGTLSDLSQRPVLLDMIVKTLPKLIASKININRPSLYRTYLEGEIKRQKVQKRRELLISTADRFMLLQRLAFMIHTGSTPTINFADGRNLVEQYINPPKVELDAYTRDFLTNSFLIRKGDDYHFSHKSIMEYLVAVHFYEEIKQDSPETFGHVKLGYEILRFLKEFELNRETLFRWLSSTKNRKGHNGPLLGGNVATLLWYSDKAAFVGKDLSGMDLTKAMLGAADLRSTKLDRTILRGASLAGAKFSKTSLLTSLMGDTYVTFYCLLDIGPKSQLFSKLHEASSYLFHCLNQSESVVHSVGTEPTHDGGRLLVRVSAAITDINDLERRKQIIADRLQTTVAVYADECEQLVASIES
jgi:NACHT domain/Restriction endonuclease/Pentapeptide repeats (8 copies)